MLITSQVSSNWLERVRELTSWYVSAVCVLFVLAALDTAILKGKFYQIQSKWKPRLQSC